MCEVALTQLRIPVNRYSTVPEDAHDAIGRAQRVGSVLSREKLGGIVIGDNFGSAAAALSS